jgi:Protein of unknown function (DUF3667)
MEKLVTHTCKSCGNEFIGSYCNLCGEKILHASDRSFKKLLSNILITITFADSKFIKTLWLILRRPGFISKEFAEGRRIKYLQPLSLFFVLNLIYFLFPLIQLFNASLNTQLGTPLAKFYKGIVIKKAVAMDMDLASFSLVYNLKTVTLAKLMVMVFVVISSLPLNILYRKRNRYFTDHVGYMVELACFNLFLNAIALTVLAKFLGAGKYLDELTLTFIFIATNLYFIVRSSHEFYAEKGWRLVIKSILMVLFLKVSLEIYRAVLFFATIWSL